MSIVPANLITLIRSPSVLPAGLTSGTQGVPPIGLAYLASYLKSYGIQVRCIDTIGSKINQYTSWKNRLVINGLTLTEIVARIPEDSYLIGISCMFSNEWSVTKDLIIQIRIKFPDAFLVLGGEHATAEYHAVMKESSIDACVLGEGEKKFLELINYLNGDLKADLTGVVLKNAKGTISKRNDVQTLSRIKDIKSLPWPAWEEFELENYLSLGLGYAMRGKRSMPILASRGCPYRCTFCSNEQMWTTKWQPRDIDDLVNEMKSYIKKYKVEHFEFYDLTAIVSKEWTKIFCKKLIEENLNITWSLPSGTRSEALDSEVIILLKAAGLLKIVYAPESGSKKLLKKIQKEVNLENMLVSMRTSVKNGIIVKANMVTCFPEETLLDVFWDFIFIFRMALAGVHDVSCFCFAPYPGSILFNKLISSGKIKRDESFNEFLEKNVFNSPLDNKSWSEFIPSFLAPFLTLGGMAFFYSLQFLFRPIRFFKMLNRFIGKKPLITSLDLIVDGLFKDFFIRKRFFKKYKHEINGQDQVL